MLDVAVRANEARKTQWRTPALASQAAVEHLSLPYDPATRRLFGVPWWLPMRRRPASGTPWRRILLRWTPIRAVSTYSGREWNR